MICCSKNHWRNRGLVLECARNKQWPKCLFIWITCEALPLPVYGIDTRKQTNTPPLVIDQRHHHQRQKSLPRHQIVHVFNIIHLQPTLSSLLYQISSTQTSLFISFFFFIYCCHIFITWNILYLSPILIKLHITFIYCFKITFYCLIYLR